jgi:hypothetical protein
VNVTVRVPQSTKPAPPDCFRRTCNCGTPVAPDTASHFTVSQLVLRPGHGHFHHDVVARIAESGGGDAECAVQRAPAREHRRAVFRTLIVIVTAACVPPRQCRRGRRSS